SGNYRNFFEVDGRKYAHIINPKTGYPQQTDLLSVSVLADECALADAWATALMAMGLEAAWDKANQMGLEVYFIYGKPDGTFGIRHTDGFGRLLQ
ncbi:MAG: FAD:protein FMN transferase, partial [Bacteroidetes bacterium]